MININMTINYVSRLLSGVRKKAHPVWALTLGVAALVGISWLLTGYLSLRAQEELKLELVAKTRMMAATINPERAKEIHFSPSDSANPVYHRLRSQLMSYANATGLASIYTLARRNGELHFGPESLTEDDSLASPPGTVYRNPPSVLHSLLEGEIEDAVVGPYTDEYGTFISSFAPVSDPVTGQTIMVVGMDIDSCSWLSEIRRDRMMKFLVIMFVLVIIIYGIYLGTSRVLMSMKILGQYRYRGVLSVLLLGFTLTGLAVAYNYTKQEEQRRSLYQSLASDAMEELQHRLRMISDHILPTLVDFVLASRNVTPNEFGLFTRHILNDRVIQTVTWLPVDKGDKPEPSRMISEPGNMSEDGRTFDIDGSREMIISAMSGSTPVVEQAAGRIKGGGETVVNIFQPVCYGKAGVIKGLFILGIKPSGLLVETGGKLEITISENPRVDGNNYQSRGIAGSHRALASLDMIYPLFMFDRSYSVVVMPGENFPNPGILRSAVIVSLAGVAITVLLSLAIWLISNSRILLERELATRTAELRQSKEQYQALFDNMLNGASYCKILTDQEGKASDFVILRTNSAFDNLTGLISNEITGQRASQVAPWLFDGPIDWIDIFGKAALKKEGATIECYSERINKWFNVSVYGAQSDHFVCIYEDVTGRKQFDNVMRENYEKLEGIFDSMQAGVMVIDQETHLISYVNSTAAAMIGLSAGEIIHHHCQKFVCPAEIGDCPISQGKKRIDNSKRTLLTVDGRQIPILKTVVETVLEGRPVLLESFVDMSEQARMEMELREHKMFIENMIDNIPNPVFYKNLSGVYLGCNRAFSDLLGVDKEKIIGRTVFELCPAENAEIYHRMDQELLSTGGKQVFEYEVNSKGHGLRHMMFNKSVYHDSKGEVAGIVGSMLDLTDRQRIQTELRKLSTAVEQSPSMFVITDRQGNIKYVNPRFCRVTGYSADEVIGQNPRILKSGETSPEEYRRLWEALEAGKQWKGEFHNRRKDGSLYWEEATIGPIVNTDGTFDHYLAVKTDITERKQAASVQDSIYKISEISSSSESLPELFGGIHMVVDEIMNTSNFYIALVNQKTNMLEFPYFVDERDPRPVPRPLGMGLTEYVIRTGAPLLASPLVQKRLYDSGEVELVGTPSTDWLGVPLKIGHAVMGALVVQSYKAQVRFGMPELTMLNYISDNIAIAIQRKSAEDEKNRLLAELKESLVNIKTLKGLVPICSSCKKIRNDFGYWQQVEEYVAEHTEADFSHGLCDECAHKLYPQYFRKLKNKTAGDEIG